MKNESLTAATGVRKWTNALMSESLRASNRSQVRTMKYIKRVYEANNIEELEDVHNNWDLFDTELCAALTRSATGTVDRELQLYQERCARRGIPVAGRAVLYIMLKRFELDGGQAMRVNLNALNALKHHGELEAYRDALDSMLTMMTI